MIVSLLKRFLKGVLHDAAEEWLVEIGVPTAAVEERRRERIASAAAAEAKADAEAVAALGIMGEDAKPLTALPMPAAARTTPEDGSDGADQGSGPRRRSRRGRSK